jgi:flagellar FliL protein
MSAAATADAPPKKGNKKLIIIIAAVLVLVLGGGAGAMVMMKNKAAAEAEAEEEGPAKPSAKKPAAKKDPAAPPTFVPLEPFTVNLADRETDRYAQVGITLEVDAPEVADQIKNFMPAIRNNVLMVLSSKTAAQLLDREGKERLAREIRREAVRPLGYELEEEEEEAAAEDDTKPRKKRRKVEEYAPVTAVHFSNFIVQ